MHKVTYPGKHGSGQGNLIQAVDSPAVNGACHSYTVQFTADSLDTVASIQFALKTSPNVTEDEVGAYDEDILAIMIDRLTALQAGHTATVEQGHAKTDVRMVGDFDLIVVDIQVEGGNEDFIGVELGLSL